MAQEPPAVIGHYLNWRRKPRLDSLPWVQAKLGENFFRFVCDTCGAVVWFQKGNAKVPCEQWATPEEIRCTYPCTGTLKRTNLYQNKHEFWQVEQAEMEEAREKR